MKSKMNDLLAFLRKNKAGTKILSMFFSLLLISKEAV